MPFNNTKYDIELNGIPYRIENYRKSEAETFIPRLGSGNQSESEFDLLKSRSIESFKGGMLQREWKDDNAYFGSESLVPLFDDGVLYPVSSLSAAGASLMGKSTVTARAQTKEYLFLAINNYNGTQYNTVKRIDTSGAITTLTLPVAVANNLAPIRTLVIWNNQIWGSSSNDQLFYCAMASTTFNSVAGGIAFDRMVVFQDLLYGSDASTNLTNVNLYKYTGNTTTASVTSVGSIGAKTPDYTADLFIFNGRIFLTRTDGMWAYDGIRLAPVDDASRAIDVRNFRFPNVLKGYLYYWMADGMYRYNGSMVEKLYDISEVGFPVDVCVGKNRLWIAYSNSAFSGSSRYDKSMGYDFSVGSSIDGRVAIFDGKAMFTYARTANDGKPASPDMNGQGENNSIAWFNNTIYVFTYYSKSNPGIYFSGSTNELAQTGTQSWKILTSIFDGDFAMINKSLENIELVLDVDATADEDITVEYRTTGFSGNTGWATLGTIKTQSRLQEFIYRNNPAGINFKKIQLRFSGTTTIGYGFKKIVLRYLLVPEFKWQWNFSVNAFGDNPLEPLKLKDLSSDTQAVAVLRGNIYTARALGVPVAFTDIDQLDLTGALNNSATTVPINTTSLLKPSGFVRIDDEIIKYTAKTSNSLTGCTRGALGSAAATHADNAAVFPYYRAIVRKLSNERIEMDDTSSDREEDKSHPSQITVVLQEV